MSSGIIQSLKLFEVDKPIKIKLKGIESVLQVTGSCFKASMEKERISRFAYIIEGQICHGDKTRPLQVAFVSKQDANDLVSIGNLMLQHMEKKGNLLGQEENNTLSIEDSPKKEQPFLKNTFNLSQTEMFMDFFQRSVVRPFSSLSHVIKTNLFKLPNQLISEGENNEITESRSAEPTLAQLIKGRITQYTSE